MPTAIAQLVNYLPLLRSGHDLPAVSRATGTRARMDGVAALERVLLVVAMPTVIAMVPALNFRTSVAGPGLFAIAAAATIARLGLRRRRSRRSRD